MAGRTPHVTNPRTYGVTDAFRDELREHPISGRRLLLELLLFAIALVVVVVGLGLFLATGPR